MTRRILVHGPTQTMFPKRPTAAHFRKHWGRHLCYLVERQRRCVVRVLFTRRTFRHYVFTSDRPPNKHHRCCSLRLLPAMPRPDGELYLYIRCCMLSRSDRNEFTVYPPTSFSYTYHRVRLMQSRPIHQMYEAIATANNVQTTHILPYRLIIKTTANY